MEPIEASFLSKLRRAEKHVQELEVEIAKYGDRRPYSMSPVLKGKKHTGKWKLQFSERPENTDIGIVAADVVYNLRSGLDHLACALNPPTKRRHVYFPIYFPGVWEEPVPGENEERAKARGRWKTDTETMRPEAVAILKKLQPREDGGKNDPTVSFLKALNVLSNKDRHQRLPFIAPGLQGVTLKFWDGGGNELPGKVRDPGTNNVAYEDGAIVNAPPGAVKVQIDGTPAIAVQVGDPGNYLRLDSALSNSIIKTREFVVTPLIPYLYAPPSKKARPKKGK